MNDLNDAVSLPIMRSRRNRMLWRTGLIVIPVSAVFGAAIHNSESFLPHLLGTCPADVRPYDCANLLIYDIGFGLACGLLFALFILALAQVVPVRRVITCLDCQASGWVRDLGPNGECPRCGETRFNAKVWRSGVVSGGSGAWAAPRRYDGISGKDLQALMAAGEPGIE